jgi:hypothetical protein
MCEASKKKKDGRKQMNTRELKLNNIIGTLRWKVCVAGKFEQTLHAGGSCRADSYVSNK